MQIAEIQAELDRLEPMLTAKGIVAPDLTFRLSANVAPYVFVSWYAEPPYGKHEYRHFKTLDACKAWIDALPTPEAKALRDHNDRLAKVIDAAREGGIPDEYITPLVTVREALSSNLLTVE